MLSEKEFARLPLADRGREKTKVPIFEFGRRADTVKREANLCQMEKVETFLFPSLPPFSIWTVVLRRGILFLPPREKLMASFKSELGAV